MRSRAFEELKKDISTEGSDFGARLGAVIVLVGFFAMYGISLVLYTKVSLMWTGIILGAALVIFLGLLLTYKIDEWLK